LPNAINIREVILKLLIESLVNSGLNYEDRENLRVLTKLDDMLEHPKALSTHLDTFKK